MTDDNTATEIDHPQLGQDVRVHLSPLHPNPVSGVLTKVTAGGEIHLLNPNGTTSRYSWPAMKIEAFESGVNCIF